MDDLKTGVLLLWALCVLSIAGSLFHLIWAATPLERLLTLALFLLTAANLHRKRE